MSVKMEIKYYIKPGLQLSLSHIACKKFINNYFLQDIKDRAMTQMAPIYFRFTFSSHFFSRKNLLNYIKFLEMT